MITRDIAKAMRGYLIEPPNRNALDTKTYIARREIRSLLGSAIAVSKKPDKGHERGNAILAATIQRQGVDREYALDGEDDYAETFLRLTLYAKGIAAPTRLQHVTECIRIAVNNYSGDWAYHHAESVRVSVCIDNATIVTEGELGPVAGVSTAERWEYRYYQRWSVMHDQRPILQDEHTATSRDQKGIGHDSIGNTVIK